MTRTMKPRWSPVKTRGDLPYDLVLIGPEDREALEDLFRRSTLETRYQRFHHMLRELPHAYLADLTCEPCPHLGVAARVREGDQAGCLVGLASAATADPDAAEVAVWVADDWQRCGVGFLLMRCLLELLGQARIRTAIALMTNDNGPAWRLLRAVAPDAAVRPVDSSTMEVSIPVAPQESGG
jgi:GNAT superfamily N-acetyltransferase